MRRMDGFTSTYLFSRWYTVYLPRLLTAARILLLFYQFPPKSEGIMLPFSAAHWIWIPLRFFWFRSQSPFENSLFWRRLKLNSVRKRTLLFMRQLLGDDKCSSILLKVPVDAILGKLIGLLVSTEGVYFRERFPSQVYVRMRIFL